MIDRYQADSISINMPVDSGYSTLLRILATGISKSLNLNQEENADLKIILSEAYILKYYDDPDGFINIVIELYQKNVNISLMPFINNFSDITDSEKKWSLSLIKSLADEASFIRNNDDSFSLRIHKKLINAG